MRGIDISNWQSGLDPSDLDIDFCICKATEGLGYTDPCCDGFVNDCINSGILWGFYHFARENDPSDEAEYFYNECLGYIGKGIPVLDYETENGDNAGWCEVFLNRFHELSGVWPVLYISAYRCAEYVSSWIPDKCGLWIAGYPWDNPNWTDEDMPYDTAPWEFAAIWQFTSSLNLDGWNLDGNIAYMDAEAWGKYARSNSTPTPEPQPSGKTIDDYVWEVLHGEYGDGEQRKQLLGKKYDAVQARVNELYEIAEQVINGDWGNGWNRQQALTGAGYPYNLVQYIVNSILED